MGTSEATPVSDAPQRLDSNRDAESSGLLQPVKAEKPTENPKEEEAVEEQETGEDRRGKENNERGEGEEQKEEETGNQDQQDGTKASENTSTSSKPPPIVAFYQGGSDFKGRTLAKILSWSDSHLEYSHDYIQILFPLPESSNFMLYPAPKLDERTAASFRSDWKLRANMRRALGRMLEFFGFDYEITNEGESKDQEILSNVEPNLNTFLRAARNWVNSHNDLRITRIIRCLRCCGMDHEAAAFYSALKGIYISRVGFPRRINDRTFMYWTRAATRDLRIPPHMSDAEAASILEPDREGSLPPTEES
ncbi:hypothetical protein ABW19_dt0202332 [Dactylella cylindrospora]|nr:hypothetical protein ABW19_dt0202332 [Dactylella cylindrospora]